MLGICLEIGVCDLETPEIRRSSVYSQFTLVVCNSALPGSQELGRYYAQAREIPLRNVIALDCPTTEEISRKQFDATIHDPLRETLLSGGWWMPVRDPKTGDQSLRSTAKVLVLMHGMPVKIRGDGDFAAGTAKSAAATVDSELCTLGQPGLTTGGPLTNPYFRHQLPFHSASLPIMLVGRVDGPNAEICRRAIDDTLRAETRGLWGQAYVDLGGESGPETQTALKNAANAIRRIGVPVTADRHPEHFPLNYPLGDPILYLGAGAEHANGPFTGKGRAYAPGRLPATFTPKTPPHLRSAEEFWAGPLLDEGAAAVLGEAYETPRNSPTRSTFSSTGSPAASPSSRAPTWPEKAFPG